MKTILKHGVLILLAGVALSAVAQADDQSEIKALEERLIVAAAAKDVNRIMACYVADESLFVFDVVPPRQYVGAKAYRKDWENFLAQYPGAIKVELADLHITTDPKLAFAHYIFHMSGTNKNGQQDELNMRVTDGLQKVKGKWLISHEHVSLPVDMATGKADFLSKP